jgi:hypothetical protein
VESDWTVRGPKIDIPRLCMALQRSRYVLKRFREERMEAVRDYIGHHWSEESKPKEVPLNLIALYVNTMASSLVPQDPRTLLSTFDQAHKALINVMQSWINKEIVGIHLADTFQRAVLDALFSIGIVKVALASPADSAEVGWNLAAGSPFAERIDLDDFVFDTHAHAFGEESFIGHRFRIPLEVAKKYYGKGNRFEPQYDELYNAEGDERISVLGRTTYSGYDEEFEDHVTLWEIYLPRHKLIMTLGDNQVIGADTQGSWMPLTADYFASKGDSFSKALKTQRWLGPATGPYHILSYGVVPGNAMPKGPVQDLIDLHRAVNSCYRKLIREAERFKMVGCAMDDEDAQRLQQANDGDVVRARPDAVAEQAFGGPNDLLLKFTIHLKDMFSWLAGNLDIIAGLSPQSKTLGQDQMLNANSNRMMDDKSRRTVNFCEDVIRALCWYWHHDPLRVMRSTFEVPGISDFAIQQMITPQSRRMVRFEDLDILIDPYSLQHTTPQSRAQFMQQIVSQVWAPMQQAFMTQGITLDMNKYLQKIGLYMNQPDLSEILTVQEPPDMESLPSVGGGGGGSAGETTRNYVRRSIGNDTQANRASELDNLLSEGGSQPKQRKPQMAGAGT